MMEMTGSEYIDNSIIPLVMKITYDFEKQSGIQVTSANVFLVTVYALLMLVKYLDEHHYGDINRLWAESLNIKLAYFNRLEAVFLFKSRFLIPTMTEADEFTKAFNHYITQMNIFKLATKVDDRTC
jgi:hypothetical protein